MERQNMMMEGNMLKVPAMIICLLAGLSSLDAADAQPSAPETDATTTQSSSEMSREQAITNLKALSNLQATIEEMSKWAPEKLRSERLRTSLLTTLSNNTILKSERMAILQFLVGKYLEADAIPAGDLAKVLLEMMPQTTSPSMLQKMMNSLIQMENIKNEDVKSKIEDLVMKVITDAAKPKKDQEYAPALHITCIKTITAKRFTAKIFEGFKTMLANPEKIEPKLQVSIFEALGNVTANMKDSVIKKSDKPQLLKNLLKYAMENPARLPVASNENEIEPLKAVLIPIQHFLSDEDLQGQKSEGIDFLVKLILHPNVDLVKLATNSLYEIKVSEIGKTGPTINLSEMLIKAAQKVESLEGNYTAHMVTYLRLMARLSASLLNSKHADDRQALGVLLKYLDTVVQNNANWEYRTLALEGFFSLEPAVFAGKTLGAENMAVVDGFFNTCLKIMNTSDESPRVKEFKVRCAEILHEMTGQQYGVDNVRWKQWYDKEGKKYFKS